MIKKKTSISKIALLPSALKADKGKYRACAKYGDYFHQIGKDTTDRQTAFNYCAEYADQTNQFQIFNDSGEYLVRNGELEEIRE